MVAFAVHPIQGCHFYSEECFTSVLIEDELLDDPEGQWTVSLGLQRLRHETLSLLQCYVWNEIQYAAEQEGLAQTQAEKDAVTVAAQAALDEEEVR